MKYNHQTGLNKGLGERLGKLFWFLIATFILVMFVDMFFNNCGLFIKLIILVWG